MKQIISILCCISLMFIVGACADADNVSSSQQSESSTHQEIENELPLVPFE